MKRFLTVVMFLGAMAMVARTQNVSDRLVLEDITNGRFRSESMASVQVLPDGETYTQLSSDSRRVLKYSFRTGQEAGVLFDVETVKGDRLEGIDGYMMSPDGKHVLIQTNTRRIYRHSFTATYYIYDVRNHSIVQLSKNGPQQTPLFSPDGHQIAFVRDNNIFLVCLLNDNAEIQVTTDGRRNEVINGIPDWVNEEEFGFSRAMVFTADSRQLAWIRYDESQVKQFSMPLFKGLMPEKSEFADYPGNYTYKYPIAGERNSTCTVWSYDVGSRQTRQLQVPVDADGYIPRIVMTSDPSRIAVYTLNRHQDCLRIYMVNPQSTLSLLTIEEQVSRYVKEEAIDGICMTDKHILLPSDRDGWMHLYLYSLDGQLLRQVDKGNYDVSDVYGYDEKTGRTYFASHEPGATEQRVWVAQKNGKRECLTPASGWNRAIFSADYRYFIHTWSDRNTPPIYEVCNNNGKPLRMLIDNQQLKDKLNHYQFGKTELCTITTADGVELNAWLIKPADFDVTRKYPVVMYQYGGPGSQQVKNSWDIGMAGQGALLEKYLCQQGFICVCVDNRGTGGRGADFEKCTYLKLGQLEAHDQVEAAIWLGQQSYVDKNRIAIWGWSFGGFNTLMAMSEGRGVFRAGIAIAPPTSWRYYDTIYTERFMRTPKENADGYEDCPISRAGKLHGALLLCHGMADDNVHFRHTAEFTEALVQADKDFSQLVFTNRNHSIYGGNTRNHLFRQCITFFEKELTVER